MVFKDFAARFCTHYFMTTVAELVNELHAVSIIANKRHIQTFEKENMTIRRMTEMKRYMIETLI